MCSHHVDVSGLNTAVESVCQRLGCAIKHVSRGHFDDTQGWELIQNYGTLDASGTAPTPATYLAAGAAGTSFDKLNFCYLAGLPFSSRHDST